jgi:hypothetical protein
MTERIEKPGCAEVEERMAEILDGTAPDAILDHIADCDACRDARHDAERLRQVVLDAGADYRPPGDLELRLMAALDRRSSETPETPATPAPDQPEPSVERHVTEKMELAHAPTLPSTPPRAEPEAEPRASETTPEPQQEPRAAQTSPEPARTEPIESKPLGRKERVEERPKVTPISRSWRTKAGGAVGLVAIAAAGLLLLRSKPTEPEAAELEGWRGTVVAVSNASGGDDGLEICDPGGGSCRPVKNGDAAPAGSVLVTNERTRARLTLEDGSELVLDRGTRLALSGERGRQGRLERGSIVADIAHREGQRARFDLARGHVEVLGTKFALRAADEMTTVDVSRGAVELVDGEGRKVTVRAGEEGRVLAGVPPYVSSAPALGEAIAWSESTLAEREPEEVVARGLGELKAKKPSSDQELSGAVTLTSHKVKVRVAGALARTEVDETFTNHTDDVLEGIYRFPIPPDAKIDRLALEVDGKLEEGAFLDRDRAAAIWRGAIVNAAPQKRLERREEIVWVPGPWKDPALLEWQRGGRFELRIFPIPKRGARRVVLAYTQVLAPTGGVRRYSYPLAHDPSGSTKVDDFEVDVQVRGHDESFGVRAQGYELAKQNAAGAEELRMSARGFVPAGDLTLEFALPNRNAELTAWGYRPAPGERAKPKPAAASAVDAAVKPRADDDKAYVAIALRPQLPRRLEAARRSFAFVVDSSRSMYGESYRRAVGVAVKTVRELDPADRFTLLACDTDCRALSGGMQQPGAQAAQDVKRFLEGIQPEGGSDVTASIRNARAAASSERSGELRIVYIGDGTPTVGPIRPAYVTRAVQEFVPASVGTVTAVAVGADSDLDTLAALARGGGGVVLPFVPGQGAAEVAYAVLGATYGNALSDVRVELPPGLEEVSPKEIDTIVAGSEAIVVARTDKSEIEGTVVLRGKLGKEGFEQRYPLKLAVSESKGNAFVPRLFAALRIGDLERETGADAKKEAIRLSSEFDVASRFTSLLVLESEAMFRAFGLDNKRSGHEWTGEEEAESAVAAGEVAVRLDDDVASAWGAPRSAGPVALGGAGSSMPRPAAKPMPAEPMSPPPAQEAKKKTLAADDAFELDAPRRRPPSWGGRRMIPMRRIWERQGTIAIGSQAPATARPGLIVDLQRELDANPNRRELVKKLFVLNSLAGDIEQASSIAERWSEKEPLDPEALTARADLAARGGDRELAIRILGSVADVRPGDIASQKRLARLHRWAGRPAVGCRHAIALAQLRSGDASLLAEAVSCGRQTGESRMVEEMLSAAEPRVRKTAEAQIAALDKQKDGLSGDLRIQATWSGGADLDLALLDPDGNRVSWLGAPTRAVISATDVVSTSREGLALRGGKTGEYVIEVVRASGSGPIRGELVIHAAGRSMTAPFVLDDVRKTVGIARINLQSRLVPL